MRTEIFSVSPDELAELISKQVIPEIQQIIEGQSKTNEKSELLSTDELAHYLKVTKPTIWRYRKRGKITPVYFENKVYYRRSEIEEGFYSKDV